MNCPAEEDNQQIMFRVHDSMRASLFDTGKIAEHKRMRSHIGPGVLAHTAVLSASSP
jgi:hypothetical protein